MADGCMYEKGISCGRCAPGVSHVQVLESEGGLMPRPGSSAAARLEQCGQVRAPRPVFLGQFGQVVRCGQVLPRDVTCLTKRHT